MFKDKDKQREANRQWMKRSRAKNAGSVLSGSKEVSQNARGLPVVDEVGDTQPVIPSCDTLDVKIANSTVFNNGEPSPPSEPRGPEDYKPKRGKDIKCFEDLSPSIQRVIDVMSTTDGKLDKTIKANRTAIAINYQHLFPDRYHSTGIV